MIQKQDETNLPEIKFQEVFDNGEVFIGRAGRFILVKNNRTPEQHQEFLNSIPNIRKNIDEKLKTKQSELETILRKYDPFDVISHIKLKNSIFDPESFKEYKSTGNNAYTEYVGCLYLTIPEVEIARRQHEPISVDDLVRIDELVKELFELTIETYVFMEHEGTDELTALDRIRFETLGRSLSVRYMYYTHHLEYVLRTLFTQVNPDLKSA